jgi:hypothetical protein
LVTPTPPNWRFEPNRLVADATRFDPERNPDYS